MSQICELSAMDGQRDLFQALQACLLLHYQCHHRRCRHHHNLCHQMCRALVHNVLLPQLAVGKTEVSDVSVSFLLCNCFCFHPPPPPLSTPLQAISHTQSVLQRAMIEASSSISSDLQRMKNLGRASVDSDPSSEITRFDCGLEVG